MDLILCPSSPDILVHDITTKGKEKVHAIPSKRSISPSAPESDSQRFNFDFTPETSQSKQKQFTAQEKPGTVEACMDIAFNMVIRAMCLAEDKKQKQSLHDLSLILREYQEEGKISWAKSILGQEIRALEQVSRVLSNKASNVQNHSTSSQHSQHQFQQMPTQTMPGPMRSTTNKPVTPAVPSTFLPQTYAAMAASGVGGESSTSNGVHQWTEVTHKKPSKPAQVPKKKTHQLILISPNLATPQINSMKLRNEINSAFTQAGAQKPVILTVALSYMKKNIILTTTESFNAEYLLEKKSVWGHLIPHAACQVNEPWHKVVIHGVPIHEFDNEEFGDMIRDEIKTFNHGLNIIGNPYWLTSAEKRSYQTAGSVIVAFATEKEASNAIRNRLYLAGKSCRVEKLYSVQPTAQCSRCQGFGHLEARCMREQRCQICAENHNTTQHKCSSCPAKGKACVHTLLKCANCNHNHKANDLSCEVYRALKDRTQEPEL